MDLFGGKYELTAFVFMQMCTNIGTVSLTLDQCIMFFFNARRIALSNAYAILMCALKELILELYKYLRFLLRIPVQAKATLQVKRRNA